MIRKKCQEKKIREKAISKAFSSTRGLGDCSALQQARLVSAHTANVFTVHSAKCTLVHSAQCTVHRPIHIYLWTSPLLISKCPAFKQSLRCNLNIRMKWTIFLLGIGAFFGYCSNCLPVPVENELKGRKVWNAENSDQKKKLIGGHWVLEKSLRWRS